MLLYKIYSILFCTWNMHVFLCDLCIQGVRLRDNRATDRKRMLIVFVFLIGLLGPAELETDQWEHRKDVLLKLSVVQPLWTASEALKEIAQ